VYSKDKKEKKKKATSEGSRMFTRRKKEKKAKYAGERVKRDPFVGGKALSKVRLV